MALEIWPKIGLSGKIRFVECYSIMATEGLETSNIILLKETIEETDSGANTLIL